MNATLLVLGLSLLTADAESFQPPVEMRLDVGDSSKVVRPGDEGRVVLVVRSSSGQPQSGTVHLEIESFDGTVIRKALPASLDPGKELRLPMPQAVFDRLGIKWLRYHWEQNGRTSAPSEAAFAYMEPTGPGARGSDGFIFAIAYGAGADNLSDEAARRSSLCGVAVARANPRWGNVQPREGTWNWEIPERILASRGKYGIEVQWLISGTPRWCRVDPEKHTPRLEPWRQFCAALAKKYRDRVELYEIWNEPDIGFFNGTIEEYLEMLPVAYEAIKEADPTSRVTTGGFASLDHHSRKRGMADRVIEHCQDSYDLIANHKHGEFSRFVEEFEHRLQPLCARVLREPKPFYLTETGMDTRHGQHFQARTLPKKIVYAWANGCVGYTWFNLHDMVRAEHARQPGFTYGLYTRLARLPDATGWDPEWMDYENTWPKAAYVAYNTVAGVLRDTAFIRRIALERDQYAYLFSSASSQVVVAWNENPRQASPHLIFRTGAEKVEVIGLMGNRSSLAPVDDLVLVQLSTEPTYWVFTGAEKAPGLEGSLAAPTGRFAGVPGKPLPLAVELWNPTSGPATVHTRWKLHERLEGGTDSSSGVTRLEPGARRRIELSVIPTHRGTPFGAAMPCELEYRLEPLGWAGHLTVPVTMAAVTVPRENRSEKPTFRLSSIDQVVNLSEHDPHTAHLLWKGRDDLSAEVWVTRRSRALELEIALRDDLHHARKTEDLAQVDSIELLLQAPDGKRVQPVWISGHRNSDLVVRAPGLRGGDARPFAVSVRAAPDALLLRFRVVLLDEAFGLSDDALSEGVRFNLRIHDNDGRGPKGWIQLAPGATPEDSSGWPVLLLERH